MKKGSLLAKLSIKRQRVALINYSLPRDIGRKSHVQQPTDKLTFGEVLVSILVLTASVLIIIRQEVYKKN